MAREEYWLKMRSRNSVVSTMSRLDAGGLKGLLVPKTFTPHLWSTQPPKPLAPDDYFPRSKAAAAWSWPLISMQRMEMSPLPPMWSWSSHWPLPCRNVKYWYSQYISSRNFRLSASFISERVLQGMQTSRSTETILTYCKAEVMWEEHRKFLCGNKMPTRCNRGFYCRSYCLLNMFRASLCP